MSQRLLAKAQVTVGSALESQLPANNPSGNRPQEQPDRPLDPCGHTVQPLYSSPWTGYISDGWHTGTTIHAEGAKQPPQQSRRRSTGAEQQPAKRPRKVVSDTDKEK